MVLWGLQLSAQNYRSFDGSGNNVLYEDYGVAGGPVQRIAAPVFSDGISSPAANDRSNPRHISNMLFDQPEQVFDSKEHSDYLWVFGQFIDHDITLIVNDPVEPLMIPVPTGDIHFDPLQTGNSVIPMSRALAREGTGTGTDNPRAYSNEITAFIDGSAVYGSSRERADWLRSFEGGKLLTSKNNLLPFNTADGEFNSGKDFYAPHMDIVNPNLSKWCVAGDVRANENVLLTVMHTLFMREHNRQCDLLADSNPDWDDEQLYQEARRRVGAIIQAITFEEWLPNFGILLPEYTGYNPEVNPNMMTVFSVAAYRLGHTMLSSNIMRMDENCHTMPQGHTTLKDVFFEPLVILESGGIEPFIKGMSAQSMQQIDCKMIDDVRNFLFGPPGSGMGMDLAAINIQRGREMGLPDFNTVRKSFGLPAYNTFEEICSEPEVYTLLETLYNNVNNIDAWVGFLAEEHVEGAMIGESLIRVLSAQFGALRNGDRFYFENDPAFTAEEIAEIKATRLVDVIKRNTEMRFMQSEAFLAKPMCDHANLVIEEEMLEMVIYPNPVRDHFKLAIFSEMNNPADLYIFDNFGRTVHSSSVELIEGLNISEIHIPNLPAGQYIVSAHSGALSNQTILIKVP
jgi:hypothetical protein